MRKRRIKAAERGLMSLYIFVLIISFNLKLCNAFPGLKAGTCNINVVISVHPLMKKFRYISYILKNQQGFKIKFYDLKVVNEIERYEELLRKLKDSRKVEAIKRKLQLLKQKFKFVKRKKLYKMLSRIRKDIAKDVIEALKKVQIKNKLDFILDTSNFQLKAKSRIFKKVTEGIYEGFEKLKPDKNAIRTSNLKHFSELNLNSDEIREILERGIKEKFLIAKEFSLLFQTRFKFGGELKIRQQPLEKEIIEIMLRKKGVSALYLKNSIDFIKKIERGGV